VHGFEFNFTLRICYNCLKTSQALRDIYTIVILHVCKLSSIAFQPNATSIASSKVCGDVHEPSLLWKLRRYLKVHFARQSTRTRGSRIFLAACNLMLFLDIVIFIYHDVRAAPHIADFELRQFALAVHRCNFIPDLVSYLV
jgi:hypothetical protein